MVRFWIVDRDPLRRRLRALLQVLPADPPADDEGARLRRSRAPGTAAAARLEERGDEVVPRRPLARERGRPRRCSTASTLLVKSPGVPGERAARARRRASAASRSGRRSSSAAGCSRRARGSSASPARTGRRRPRELLGAIFRAAGRDVAVAGNIGTPLTSVREADWVVCELSSFQLEDVHTLACDVAVLLNLEPDHLDRHGTFEAYRDAKLRIFERARVQRRAARARARRDRVLGRRPAAGRAADPRRAQPRERGRRDRRRARGRDRRRRDRRGAADVPRRAAPARAGRRGRRRPLRQRLEGDERRRRAARARRLRGRAGAPDPRRLAEGRETSRRSPPRSAPNVALDPPDRRGGARRSPRRSAAAASRRRHARPRRRARGRRGAARATSCCSARPARATTSSRTSSSAATSSGGSSPSSSGRRLRARRVGGLGVCALRAERGVTGRRCGTAASDALFPEVGTDTAHVAAYAS